MDLMDKMAKDVSDIADKLVPHTGSISLLDYFAAREPTSPPTTFMLKQFPPNPLKAKNGAPMPNSDPTAEELAAALAKWRFLCAECMVKESEKRQ